jgi:hypothetical protein
MNYQFYKLGLLNPGSGATAISIQGETSATMAIKLAHDLNVKGYKFITATIDGTIASKINIQAVDVGVKGNAEISINIGGPFMMTIAVAVNMTGGTAATRASGSVNVVSSGGVGDTISVDFAAPLFTFDDTPPMSEGFFDLPRQSTKTMQVERGTIYIDYGVDPGNQVLKLIVEVVPEFLMKTWHSEYTDPASSDREYFLYHHRGGPPNKVKWKGFSANYLRTLLPSDAESVYQYYLDKGYTLETFTDHLDIADLYKVVLEFYNIPKPLF